MNGGDFPLPEVRCPCCRALWLKGFYAGEIWCRQCGKSSARTLYDLADALANICGYPIVTIQDPKQDPKHICVNCGMRAYPQDVQVFKGD